jgi:hypothetical protein
MTSTMLVIVTLSLLAFLVAAALLFMSINTAKRKSSSMPVPKDTVVNAPADNITSGQKPFDRLIRLDPPLNNSSYSNSPYSGANQMQESLSFTRPTRDPASNRSSSGIARYSRFRMEPVSLSPSTPSGLQKPAHGQSRYELEMEYESGMRTVYDEEVGAVNFIGINIVMDTPAEVELAFYVCKRQIRGVLRSKGLDRAPTLTDIGGIVIGGDATSAWGQAFKGYLEEMCIKVGKDTYLVAHYNSHAHRPDLNELQEKIRSIQFMTSAALNNFQSNIFDTREEAVAFLLRMREIYHV